MRARRLRHPHPGPDETETSQSEQEKSLLTPLFSQIEVTDGRIWMPPSGATYFCADLPEDEQKVVWATAYPPAADLFARNAPRRHQPAGHWGAVRQAGGLYFL